MQVAPGIDQPTADVLSLTVASGRNTWQAPDFTVTDQHGRQVSLRQFRGKAVVLSFNDDMCTDLCTLLAQDIQAAQRDLGRAGGHVVFLSVNVNPFYPGVDAVRTWTDEHGLGGMANWYFGTASPAQLSAIWKRYGVYVQTDAATRSVSHGAQLYFIDPAGRQRAMGAFGMNAADTALFGHAMAQMAVDLLPRAQQVTVAGPTTPPPAAGNVAPDAPAPGFQLPSLSPGAAPISLAGLRGKPTVLNFWASSCGPCRTEMPALEAAHRYFGAKVNFVGIDVADDPARARAFARSAGVTYPLANDAGGSVAGRYRLPGTPYTVLVSPTGTVTTLHPGTFTTEQLEYVLESYDNSLAPPGS